jgi:uncharacterized BrkB/YihY/UPF0761 family membrane protein
MSTVSSADSWVRSAVSPLRRAGLWLVEACMGTVRRSIRDDITQVASQFSYNAFLATVPFLFVLVSIIGLVAEPDTFDEFLSDDADNAIPIELRQILRSALRSATNNTGQATLFLVIGLLTALYVSANVMGSLVGGLDRVRGVAHRAWTRGKLVALVIAIATSVLVVATTLALVGGSRLVESVAEELFGKGAPNVAGRFLSAPTRRAGASGATSPGRWSGWRCGWASRGCSPSTSRTSTRTRPSTGRWPVPPST